MWTNLRTAIVENDEGERRTIDVSQSDNGEIWAFDGDGSERLTDDSETAINDLVRPNGFAVIEFV